MIAIIMNNKAIVLVSGGLDSATSLAVAKSEGFECYALTFDYGQRHCIEILAAKNVTQMMGVKEHRIMTLPIGQFGGSALTDEHIDVPDYQNNEEIPITYVPARNTAFLAIALGWAEVIEAQHIFIGVNATDYFCYPDTRPEYIQAFQKMANLATKRAVEGNAIHIHTPLIYLSKTETIQLGMSLGLDYSMTVTCYKPTSKGEACGRCNSCVLRMKGFKDTGIDDPGLYFSTD